MFTCLRNILQFAAVMFVVCVALNGVELLSIIDRVTYSICGLFCLYLYTSEEYSSLTDKCVFAFDLKMPCLVRLQATISDLLIYKGA